VALFSPLFWVLLALAVAIVVAVGWRLTTWNRTLFDIWWALRPLLIPVAGILLIATLARWWLAWPAFLLAAGLAVWLLMRTWDSAAEGKRGTRVVREAFGVPVTVVAVAVLLALMAFFAVATGRSVLVDQYEFVSRGLVQLGFALWGTVLLLRLWAFAITRMRRFLAVVFLAAYVRYYIGLFVAGDVALSVADHVIWGLLLTAVVVWLVIAERRDGRPEHEQDGSRTHRLGMAASLLSAVVFALAGGAAFLTAPVEDAGMPFKETAVLGTELARPDVSAMIAAPADGRLVRRFSPLLQFTDVQRWRPIAVQEYLDEADLHGAGKVLEPRPLAAADLKRPCLIKQRKLCYALTVRCPIERADSEGKDGECEGGVTALKGYRREGTAYVRVIKDPRLLAHGPYAGKLKLLVQYWLFYAYDDWRARTLFGELRQAHEADWEVISVGFSGRSPLFVALSAHCGGTWLRWDRVRVARLHGHRFHPVVGVAEGSQANYHEPRANIPPDNWARCAGIPSSEVSALGLGYRIRDRTGVHGAVELDRLPIVRENDAVMTFPGVWGKNGVAHFYTAFGRRYDLEEPHDGPRSPRHQKTWSSPVTTIFCSDRGTWRQVAGGPRIRTRGCGARGRSAAAGAAGS